MKKNINDILIRCIKTFIQGFFGSLVVTLPITPVEDLLDKSLMLSIIIASVSAGICGVMNFILKLFEEEEKGGKHFE